MNQEQRSMMMPKGTKERLGALEELTLLALEQLGPHKAQALGNRLVGAGIYTGNAQAFSQVLRTRLLAAGYVTATTGRGRVYAITSAGRDALHLAERQRLSVYVLAQQQLAQEENDEP